MSQAIAQISNTWERKVLLETGGLMGEGNEAEDGQDTKEADCMLSRYESITLLTRMSE